MWKFRNALKFGKKQEPFDQYETGRPSHQTAVDAVPGWSCAFPPDKNVVAGDLHLYNDDRVDWALRTFGDLTGVEVLEVGPLEGMHTVMLEQRGALHVDAVEANRLCYLRCLITQQIMGTPRVSFWLGDIQHWLAGIDKHYGLALASGVLYHMSDPGAFLQQLAARCDAIFLWTHFYDEAAMPQGDPRHEAFTGTVLTRDVAGVTLHYHERQYHDANADASFCGGSRDLHYWMRRNEILALLDRLGFADIVIRSEELNHRGGPCFTLLARRGQNPDPAPLASRT